MNRLLLPNPDWTPNSVYDRPVDLLPARNGIWLNANHARLVIDHTEPAHTHVDSGTNFCLMASALVLISGSNIVRQ